jgi:hypothetical protein
MRTVSTLAVVWLVTGCYGSIEKAGDVTTDDGPSDVLDAAGDTTIDTHEDTAPADIVDVPADTTSDVEECEDGCMDPLLCCDGRCVYTLHDPDHCGGCDTPCSGTPPFCDNGVCGTAPCSALWCPDEEQCCGGECCTAGQVCCVVEGPGPWGPASCHDEVCPPGCPWCD